jgi:hypothetical protein
MTATTRGRVAIAVLLAALAFGAAFAVRSATAGGTSEPAAPTPLALPATPVPASGVALPVVALPALRRPPRPVTAPSSTPASTPAPASTPPPAAPAAPAPSTPATPPSSGGGSGKGPVLVG